MADDPVSDPKPTKTKRKLLPRLILPVILLVIGGGGLAAGIMFGDSIRTMLTGDKANEKPEKPTPVETSYLVLDQPITANLSDTGRYLQVTIGLATHGDTAAAEALKKHEVIIRSVLVDTLAEQREADVATAKARAALRQRLTTAVNSALKTAHIDAQIAALHFVSFIIQ